MLTIRKSNERGHADHGWLDSHHTFSFANYYDPAHMGYRTLRVINEDRVAPGRGFGTHSHRDMEIITYVLAGSLAHKDSMGHTETLGPNEIQRMSAGSGITHSEFNGSDSQPAHFLQIWIEPKSLGIQPSYQQFKFAPQEKRNQFKVIASANPVPGAATIHQDATVAVAELAPGHNLTYPLASQRHLWLHVIHGEVVVNGKTLLTGDAIAADNEPTIQLSAQGSQPSEIILFDLA